jgi:PAS domain S-box-containing protein
MMPLINGLEILKQARILSPEAIVIIITGNSATSSVIAALRSGADDYIQKPFSNKEFIYRIESCLETQTLMATISRQNKELAKKISQRCESEKALKESNELLEKRVTSRTKELAEANLQMKLEIEQRRKSESSHAREAEINFTIAELSKALAAISSFDDISALVLDYAKKLTESRFGYAGYIDPKDNSLVVPTLTKDIWNHCKMEDKGTVFKSPNGLWGWVIKHNKSLLSNETIKDPRYSGTPEGHIPIERFLCSPARLKNELVGQLAVGNACRDYSQNDQEILEKLADLFALALQRKNTEEKLLAKQQQYRTIFNESVAAIFILDNEMRFIKANQSGYNMLGYSEAELLGMKKNELEIKQDKRSKNSNDSLDEKRIVNFEQQLKRKDNTIITVLTNCSPLPDEHGNIIGRVCTLIDISERKHAANLLAQSEIKLQIKTRDLSEVNTALQVLLDNRQKDKKRTEEKIVYNVRKQVVPYLEELSNKTKLGNQQQELVEKISESIEKIISPFLHNLSTQYSSLTSTELSILNMISDGKRTKDIAEKLNISPKTIDSHRANIREKLGLINTKISLTQLFDNDS